MAFETVSEHRCFGGVQGFYRHDSAVIGLPMRFSVFVPPRPHGMLLYLSGLTCSEETFPVKAGAQRIASDLGLVLVAPDTSPRNTGIPGEDAEWDFGAGAGFWLDATQAPWSRHFRMETWVLEELVRLVQRDFAVPAGRVGVFGHSMGGHGALTLALRHPGFFRSVSAIAPIASPTRCPWGEKAFARYLGNDPQTWAAHDATELMRGVRTPIRNGLLIDQGLEDKFLAEQLKPGLFEEACASAGQPLTLRRHAGYDHGYYFVASVIEDHLRFHAQRI